MKKIVLFFGLFYLFYSCEDTFTVTKDEPVPIDQVRKKWDETVELVAKDISSKMNSLAFRKMLKHEVMLQFDGDYNILISSMMQRMPKYLEYESGQTLLMSGLNESLLSDYNWDVLEHAGEEYPLMQVAVQVDAENWDADNELLSVVYVPSDFDELTHDFVDGFDKDQNPIQVSTLEDPQENYVVISQNERTYEKDETVYFSNTLIRVPCCIESAPYDPYAVSYPPMDELCEDCSDEPDPTPPDNGGDDDQLPPQYVGTGHQGVLPSLIAKHNSFVSGTINDIALTGLIDPVGEVNGRPFYRGNFKYERVRSYKVGDLGDIEKWLNGAPEIRVVEFTPDRADPTIMLQIFQAEHKPDKRKDIKDKWWDCPLDEIHLWEWENTGTSVSIGMYEFDAGIFGNNNEDRKELSASNTTIVDQLVLNSDGTYTVTSSTTYTTPDRYFAMQNHHSEYMGIESISVFNNQDQFRHSRGDTDYKCWPDVQ